MKEEGQKEQSDPWSSEYTCLPADCLQECRLKWRTRDDELRLDFSSLPLDAVGPVYPLNGATNALTVAGQPSATSTSFPDQWRTFSGDPRNPKKRRKGICSRHGFPPLVLEFQDAEHHVGGRGGPGRVRGGISDPPPTAFPCAQNLDGEECRPGADADLARQSSHQWSPAESHLQNLSAHASLYCKVTPHARGADEYLTPCSLIYARDELNISDWELWWVSEKSHLPWPEEIFFFPSRVLKFGLTSLTHVSIFFFVLLCPWFVKWIHFNFRNAVHFSLCFLNSF